MTSNSASRIANRTARLRYRWLILFAAIVTALFFVATPIWIIQPFRPESQRGLALSYTLRHWSPIVTIICSLVILSLLLTTWSASGWWHKSILSLFLLFTLGLAWMARQNHFEWMFHPLAKPGFTKAAEVTSIENTDRVMAVDLNGEAVAFPVRQMAYHHVVQSVIGGRPVTVTY